MFGPVIGPGVFPGGGQMLNSPALLCGTTPSEAAGVGT